MKNQDIDNNEAVVHHIHYQKQTCEGYKREVSINGTTYSISLSSDDPVEDMNFLSTKCMEMLKKLIKEGN